MRKTVSLLEAGSKIDLSPLFIRIKVSNLLVLEFEIEQEIIKSKELATGEQGILTAGMVERREVKKSNLEKGG